MSLDPVMPPYNASDPSASFLSASCLDFLLIELVPLAHRVTQDRDASATTTSGSRKPSTDDDDNEDGDGGASKDDDALPDHNEEDGDGNDSRKRASSLAATGSGTGVKFGDEDEELDAVHYRLETLGYRVGQGLVERCVQDPHPSRDSQARVFGRGILRGGFVLT